MNFDELNYAPWERYSMEVPAVRFPHAFVGHRYLAVGGSGGAAAPGGAIGAGSESAGVAGAPGAFGGGPGGAVGVGFIASQFAPVSSNVAIIAAQPSPTLTIPSTVPSDLVLRASIGAQRVTPAPAPTLTPGPQRGGGTVTVGSLRGPGPQPSGLPTRLTVRDITGRPPPPITPPGPQGGPDNVPTLTTEQRQGCTTCGQISGDIAKLRTSIQKEQEQSRQQTLQQQESQIEQYQQQEAGQIAQQKPIDQQIQDKINLLQQLENELQQAQQAQPGGYQPGQIAPRCNPGFRPCGGEDECDNPPPGSYYDPRQGYCVPISGGVPTVPAGPVLPAGAPSFSDFLKSIGEDATCASVLAKFGIPFPAAYAICAGVQTLVGDTKALEQYARKVYDYLTGSQQGGIPTVPTAPPPAPVDHMVKVCMVCDSNEDAIRWQAGEPTPGCHIESVSQLPIAA